MGEGIKQAGFGCLCQVFKICFVQRDRIPLIIFFTIVGKLGMDGPQHIMKLRPA